MDLNLMFQNGMGSMGAINAGRQMVSDQQMAQAKLREQQLANDNSAVMNPLNAQFRQGQVAQQQAELPGIMGDSQVKASAGSVEQATTSAKVAQRLSSLSNQIGVDGMQKMGREGDIALQAAQALGSYPPAMHKEILPKIMAAYGGDPNSPIIAGILKMPDDAIQKSLQTLGGGMALAGKEYLQKSALQSDDLRNRKDIADGNNRTQLEIAKIQAASREAAAKARGAAAKYMNMDQKFTFLSSIPADERTPDEQSQLDMISKQRLSERAASAPAVAPSVLGQATPTQNAVSTAQQITNPQAQAAPAPAGGGGDIATMAKSVGWSYEPEKYMYRVGPNGKLQRAPKR